MLKEQELFFIWHIYEEANIFKLHIFWCKLPTCSFPYIGKLNLIELRKKNQHEKISGSNPPP